MVRAPYPLNAASFDHLRPYIILLTTLKYHVCLYATETHCFILSFQLLLGIEYITATVKIKMPPRPNTLRRCAFKLPQNNKYQCQKALDKHHTTVTLWYCKFHASYANDRCQVLIERTRKGSQHEQLGVFGEKAGEVSCDLHVVKSKKDDWPQIWDPSMKRKDAMSAKRSEKHDTEEQVTTMQRYALAAVPSPALLAAEYQPRQDSYPPEADVLANRLLKIEQVPVDLNAQTQASQPTSAEKTAFEGRMPQDNADFVPPILICEDPATNAQPMEANTAVTTSVKVVLPMTNYEVTVLAIVRRAPGGLFNLGHVPHIRNPNVDKLAMLALRTDKVQVAEPIFIRRPTGERRASSIPTVTVHTTYKCAIQPFGTTSSFYSILERWRLSRLRIDSLNSFQAQEASSLTRIADMYVQCCVCLEEHTQKHMRQIDLCKHQYRNLCLRKILKSSGMRQYNCVGCREWMNVSRKKHESEGGKTRCKNEY